MSAPTPEISVLLPTRDSLATLPEAIESTLAQTGPTLELIVVDDGSQDGTGDWLQTLARRDPRVVPLLQPAEGLVPALEAGRARCRAPLVARMDADDVNEPGRLARQKAWLDAHPATAAVGTLIRCFPDDEVQEGMRLYEDWQNSLLSADDIAREMFVESPLVHPSVTFRAAAVAELGGYRDLPWPEDYDLWLQLFAAGHRIEKVPEQLFRWRESGGRLTRTDARYAPERHLELKASFLAKTILRGHREIQVWGAGRGGKQLRRALAAEGIEVVRFFEVDPRKLRSTVAGTVPILPWQELARHRELPTLVAVGARGARALIRAELSGLGATEGADLWFTM